MLNFERKSCLPFRGPCCQKMAVYCYTAGAAQVRAGENPDCLKHPGYELCEHNAAQTFYFVVHEEVQPSITVTIAIDNISP
jgi:hypothetical protein